MARKKTAEKIQSEPTRESNERARVWVWMLAIFFGVAIAGLWFWSYRIKLASISWQTTPESKLVSQSQSDWDTIFSQVSAQENKQILKNMVGELLQKMSAASTTAVATSTVVTGTKK